MKFKIKNSIIFDSINFLILSQFDQLNSAYIFVSVY